MSNIDYSNEISTIFNFSMIKTLSNLNIPVSLLMHSDDPTSVHQMYMRGEVTWGWEIQDSMI